MNEDITFILGGVRSGKSRFAEKHARQSKRQRIYLATAEAYDAEMETRIARHQEDRGDGWTTIEEPVDLGGALIKQSSENNIILVDCLTLWLSNIMGRELAIDEEVDKLLAAIKNLPGPIIFVSNEVGQGIVPDNALARAFRDHAGRLHQRLAEIANSVYFVTAGLPQKLK
ncbi:MAG: bifunctional adenosylcobinamide kinase/adenosylcobinamide-phosphate guanylyltransferase [Sneathiella sp.]|nr:bifunctional adenosylcobinamide kinase/adenosylcobinamide-phosphate guanylyltransferase [Sneathiella sp.]